MSSQNPAPNQSGSPEQPQGTPAESPSAATPQPQQTQPQPQQPQPQQPQPQQPQPQQPQPQQPQPQLQQPAAPVPQPIPQQPQAMQQPAPVAAQTVPTHVQQVAPGLPQKPQMMQPMQPMNPYAAPTIATDSPWTANTAGQVSHIALEMLNQTKPWVYLMAILGFLCAILTALGAVVVMLASSETPRFGPAPSATTMSVIGIGYLLMAALQAGGSALLLRYGLAISQLMSQPLAVNLDHALTMQKSFWRYIGICTTVCIILTVGLFLALGLYAQTNRF